MAKVANPADVTVDRQELSDSEMQKLRASFERSLEDVRALGTESVNQKIKEYFDEIVVAAEIARAQFDQPFGGANPDRGTFAITRIDSGYFGYNSWEGNLTGLSSGSVNTWINDGKPDNLGGTDTSFGNPLQIGEEAVHCITDFGTYNASPVVSRIGYRVNQEPRTTVPVKYEWTETDVAKKFLDSALILPEGSEYEAQVYSDVGGDAQPYFGGVSFIKSKPSELLSPSDFTDDTSDTDDNIVAKG